MQSIAEAEVIRSSQYPKTGNRISLACLQCRERHMKCDALKPSCSRCCEQGKSCTYSESRRGKRRKVISPEGVPGNPPDGNHDSITAMPPDHISSHVPGMNDFFQIGSTDAGILPSLNDLDVNLQLPWQHLNWPDPSNTNGFLPPVSGNLPTPAESEIEQDELIELYYTWFHPSHPFVLPRKALGVMISRNHSRSIQFLITVLRFIGSKYTTTISSTELQSEMERYLDYDNINHDGCYVQALLLAVISLYWSDSSEKAYVVLDRAVRSALELGMNSADFAVRNGESHPVLEESWRRTWWLIYMIAHDLAVMGRQPPLIYFHQCSQVGLPCEEAAYELEEIPPTRTWSEYERREFLSADVVFSSFSYLIDAVRCAEETLLGLLKLDDNAKWNADCDASDAHFMAWEFLLPPSKQEVVNRHGQVDELMFLAYMLMYTCKVFVHRPLSRLRYSSVESVSSCSPPPAIDNIPAHRYLSADTHTVKILQTLEKNSRLLTFPGQLLRHSPTVMCLLASITIAHLSACRYILNDEALTVARARIRLSIGSLNMFGGVWCRGQRVAAEVRQIANDVLFPGVTPGA